jgi:hypothetical protein
MVTVAAKSGLDTRQNPRFRAGTRLAFRERETRLVEFVGS